MVYDFLIPLKKRDYKAVDQVSRLMYFFALIVFGYYYFHLQKSGAAYLYFVTGIILCWIFTIFKKRRNEQVFFRVGLLIGAAGWFVGSQTSIWMGILYVLAAAMEKQVKVPQEIGFSQQEVYFNSFPRKVLPWNKVNNALIKDGLITIDQKNNKIFQREIEGDFVIGIEKEFNDFCNRCISAGNKNNEMNSI